MPDVPLSVGDSSGAVVHTIDQDGVARFAYVRFENEPGRLLLDVDPKAGFLTVYACAHSGKWIRWLFQKYTDQYSAGLWVFISAHSMRRVSNRLWEFEVVEELVGGGVTGVVWIEGSEGGKSIDSPSDTVTEVFIGDGHGDEYPDSVTTGASKDPVVIADGKPVLLDDGGTRIECRSIYIMQRSVLLRDRTPKQTLTNSTPWCRQLKVWAFENQSMRMSVHASILAQFTGKVYLPLICTSTGFTGGIRKPSGKVLAIPYDVDSFPDDNNASGVTGMLMWGSIGMVEIEVGNYKSAGELNIDLHRIRTDGGYHKNYWLCGSGMVGVGTKIHQRLNPGDTVSREFTVKFTI